MNHGAASKELRVGRKVQILTFILQPGKPVQWYYMTCQDGMIKRFTIFKNTFCGILIITEKSRHKVNPGILYAPKAAGGIELISTFVAVKAQRFKYALLWL